MTNTSYATFLDALRQQRISRKHPERARQQNNGSHATSMRQQSRGPMAIQFEMKADKPIASVRNVTPGMAERWLASNEHNRELRPTRVTWLALIIQRGEWELTGDAIVFDTTGRLINGQHRLAAIVATGISVPLLLLRGIPPKTQDVMDTGLSRKLLDALKMRGEAYSYALAASLRWLDQLNYIRSTNGKSVYFADAGMRSTTPRLLALFDANPGLRDSNKWIYSHYKPLKLRPGLVAALHHAFGEVDADARDTFFDLLVTGVGLEANDPILLLRNWLIKMVASVHKPQDARVAAMICKAWVYWRDGRQPHSLTWHGGGAAHARERFPAWWLDPDEALALEAVPEDEDDKLILDRVKIVRREMRRQR